MKEILARKKQIRTQIAKKWQQISNSKKQKFSYRALEKISQFKVFLNACMVFVYAPQPTREVDFTQMLMEKYPQKKYAFPIIQGDQIKFSLVENYQQLVIDKFNILTPATHNAVTKADLIFIPAVACDNNKNRLGRGRGYYDRFLADKKEVTKICVLPKFAVLDKIPTEFFDEPVNYIFSISDE